MVPATGLCVITGFVSQLSVTVAEVVKSEIASPTLNICVPTQVENTGFSVSVAVFILKAQSALLPEASVTVTVTVIPLLNALPAAGICVTIGLGSILSVAVTNPV